MLSRDSAFVPELSQPRLRLQTTKARNIWIGAAMTRSRSPRRNLESLDSRHYKSTPNAYMLTDTTSYWFIFGCSGCVWSTSLVLCCSLSSGCHSLIEDLVLSSVRPVDTVFFSFREGSFEGGEEGPRLRPWRGHASIAISNS
jgi:hypothetical protein